MYKSVQKDERLPCNVHDIWKSAQAPKCLIVKSLKAKIVHTVTKGKRHSAGCTYEGGKKKKSYKDAWIREREEYCNDVVDYIEHFLFDCPTIKKSWNYKEQYILITFDIQTHLTVFDILFGIKQHNCGKVKTKRINHVIFIAKICISMYKKANAFFPLSMIFENQLRLRNV